MAARHDQQNKRGDHTLWYRGRKISYIDFHATVFFPIRKFKLVLRIRRKVVLKKMYLFNINANLGPMRCFKGNWWTSNDHTN